MYKSSAAVPDSLVEFAHQIHDIERITPTEEVVLGEKTQEAIRLQKIYEGLQCKLAREPTNEEWCAAAGKINMEALSQAIEEGLEAKNKLVTSNLRMVQGVVNVYIRNGLKGHYNAGDLMQEGIMVRLALESIFRKTLRIASHPDCIGCRRLFAQQRNLTPDAVFVSQPMLCIGLGHRSNESNWYNPGLFQCPSVCLKTTKGF
jgi:hypothetical protein